MHYADSTTPDNPQKPLGAISLQLFLGISADDDKKTATYHARWCLAQGEVGPWSLPTTITIAA